MVTLIDKLVQRQKEAKLNDFNFAKRLGIARSLWSQTKTGDRKVRLALLKGIVRTYPELCPEVIKFLRDGDFK